MPEAAVESPLHPVGAAVVVAAVVQPWGVEAPGERLKRLVVALLPSVANP